MNSKYTAMRCRSTEGWLREERVIARRAEERRSRRPGRSWLLPIVVLCMIGIAGGIGVL